jgi:hypothetical protein
MNPQFFIANAEQLLPYALLLLVFLILAFQSELARNRCFDAPVLGLLLLFAGFRDAMTPDMERYRQMYEAIGSGESFPLEALFVFLSRLLNWFGFDYHALFFMFTFLTLLFIYLGIKNYTSHVKLSLLLYTLIPACFLNLFVEMREAGAVSVAFYATSVWNRKDIRLRFRLPAVLALAALSFAFHTSAILYWPIVLVSYRFIRKPHSLLLYLPLIITTLFIPTSLVLRAVGAVALPLVPSRYQGFLTVAMDIQTALAESGQLLKTLIYAAIAVSFVIWRSRSSMRNTDENIVPLNLFVIGVVILNLTRSLAEASRLAYFFLIYQIVIFPALLEKVQNRVARLATAYIVVLFYFAQFAWGLAFYSEEAANYPFLHFQNVVFSLLH